MLQLEENMPARVPGSGSIAIGIFDNPILDEVLMVALIIVVVIIEVYEYCAPDPSALPNKKEVYSSSYGDTQTVRTKFEDGRASAELKEKATGLRSRIATELLLDDISDDVGTCWCKLGLKLKIARSKIHNLGEEYRYNREKAYALLMMWKQQQGKRATVGRLADALSSIGEKVTAEKILWLVSRGDHEEIGLTVKCNLSQADLDSKLMLCEDADGNKFLVKLIENCKDCNFEEIQKNHQFLEAVATAAHEMGKTAEQRRQKSLKGISSEVQGLKQQLKSQHRRNTWAALGSDATAPSQRGELLLQYCEEQHLLFQGIYQELIKLVGEVADLPRGDSVKCFKQLGDFTKELQNHEKKLLFPKIEQLNNQKQHLNKQQVTQVEKLEKWRREQKDHIEQVEKLLSNWLKPVKVEKHHTQMGRSPPFSFIKPQHGRKRTKSNSSKGKSPSTGEPPEVYNRRCISAPLCAQCAEHIRVVDMDENAE